MCGGGGESLLLSGEQSGPRPFTFSFVRNNTDSPHGALNVVDEGGVGMKGVIDGAFWVVIFSIVHMFLNEKMGGTAADSGWRRGERDIYRDIINITRCAMLRYSTISPNFSSMSVISWPSVTTRSQGSSNDGKQQEAHILPTQLFTLKYKGSQSSTSHTRISPTTSTPTHRHKAQGTAIPTLCEEQPTPSKFPRRRFDWNFP